MENRSLWAMAAAALGFAPIPAEAHVKWFCAYNVAGQPDGLASVLCHDFEYLVAVSAYVLTLAVFAETTAIGPAIAGALDRVFGVVYQNHERILRGTVGFFLVSLWNLGGVMLTPETKTGSEFFPWFQLAMAASLLFRPTMPFCGIGIVVLYGASVAKYGVFHMMDYPIFLAIAAWIVMVGFGLERVGRLGRMDVLRYGAAITLMWASIEKWAYPEWTAPLMVTHPGMAMGLDKTFFMQSAGAVEFVMAFALAWTPLVRRLSAIVLTFVFVAAIGGFGKVDAIGHSCIIAILVAVAAEPALPSTPVPRRWRMTFATPATYAVALVVFIACYYGLHAAMYGTNIL